MTDVHYVLHAPQGDTYADLLFTMIERRDHRPPVSFTTFQASDLGADTASLFRASAAAAYARFQPQALVVGASCTAELIQDDPAGLAQSMNLPVPVVGLDLPSYARKENFGVDETFLALVRALAYTPQKNRRTSACEGWISMGWIVLHVCPGQPAMGPWGSGSEALRFATSPQPDPHSPAW